MTNKPTPQEVNDEISRLKKLVPSLKKIYECRWGSGNFSPYENEGVVHLIVPLLKALGWPPERMGFETYFCNHSSETPNIGIARLDISLYLCDSRKQKHLAAIIEAKQIMGEKDADLKRLKAIVDRYWQPWFKNYHSDNEHLPDRFIITSGLRYIIYLKDKDSNEFKQHICFDLESDEILDANELTEALEIMSPRG